MPYKLWIYAMLSKWLLNLILYKWILAATSYVSVSWTKASVKCIA